MSNKDQFSAHPSLPARPPPSTYSAPPSRAGPGAVGRGHGGTPAAFGGFTPRSVITQAPPAPMAASPTTFSQPTVSAPYQSTSYPTSNTYYNGYPAYGSVAPVATYNAPTVLNRGYTANYDPEEEARLAEWNSAYIRDDTNARKTGNANATTRNDTTTSQDLDPAAVINGKQKTVVREGGGKTWEDASLLEWDPLHPRLFIGNLAGEVTDDSLLKAFSKYPSVSKARVVRDKRSTKSKSYGFVSFSNTDDYFRAAKEMQGKYIGSHPVLVKRATSEVKAVTKKDGKKDGKYGKQWHNNKRPNAAGSAATLGASPFLSSGVQKKGKGSGPRVLG